MNTNILLNTEAGDWETTCKARPLSWQPSNRVWGGVCRAKITMKMGLRLRAGRQDEKVPVMLNTNFQTNPSLLWGLMTHLPELRVSWKHATAQGKNRGEGPLEGEGHWGAKWMDYWLTYCQIIIFWLKKRMPCWGQKPWVGNLDKEGNKATFLQLPRNWVVCSCRASKISWVPECQLKRRYYGSSWSL